MGWGGEGCKTVNGVLVEFRKAAERAGFARLLIIPRLFAFTLAIETNFNSVSFAFGVVCVFFLAEDNIAFVALVLHSFGVHVAYTQSRGKSQKSSGQFHSFDHIIIAFIAL